MVEFRCTVCGAANVCAEASFSREGAFCTACGSTVRMRAAIAALSLALFGRVHEIARFPKRPRFRGLGLSDWPGYAERLGRVVEYRNTHVERPPRLDVTAVPERERGRNDFLLSIDVFEHVPPPVSRAFEGAAALLKPRGALILSVPYTLEERTAEHFPSLHRFEIAEERGVRYLLNTTADGRTERFDDLRFHGGDGLTLEMRLFCKQHVEQLLEASGFGDVQTVDRIADYGIIYDNPCSHTFLARRRPLS